KAIQNLKIDKITVWDSGSGGEGSGTRGATADFLSGLIGSLPQIHELADQAGIDLPDAFVKVSPQRAKKREVVAEANGEAELPAS
ncbi:MAG: flotillin family protein, partial [Planctomycetota bacterium]